MCLAGTVGTHHSRCHGNARVWGHSMGSLGANPGRRPWLGCGWGRAEAGLGSPVLGGCPSPPRREQEARAGLWPIRRHRSRGRGRNFSCLPGTVGPAPTGRAGARLGHGTGVGALPWLTQGCAQPTAPRGRVSSLRDTRSFCGKGVISPCKEGKPHFGGEPSFLHPLAYPRQYRGSLGQNPTSPCLFLPRLLFKSWSGRAQPPAPFRKGQDIFSCLAQGVGICHGCLHPPHPAAASFSCVLPWGGGEPIQSWPWGQLWGLCDARSPWCFSV